MDFSNLERAYPLQADRIDTDKHGIDVVVAGASLRTLYEADLLAVSDIGAEEDVAAVHDDFCSRHACLGSIIAPASNEQFGHVMSMNAFRRFVASPSGAAGGLPPRSGMIGPVPTRAMSSAEANAILLANLSSEPLRQDGAAIWCFQSYTSPEHPLDDLDVTLLPCRLGLKKSKENAGTDTNWIAFLVDPASTEWRRPTFADTTWLFLTDWKPGGVTAASPEYTCGAGLPEAIGPGVTYGQLSPGSGPFAAAWPTA